MKKIPSYDQTRQTRSSLRWLKGRNPALNESPYVQMYVYIYIAHIIITGSFMAVYNLPLLGEIECQLVNMPVAAAMHPYLILPNHPAHA